MVGALRHQIWVTLGHLSTTPVLTPRTCAWGNERSIPLSWPWQREQLPVPIHLKLGSIYGSGLALLMGSFVDPPHICDLSS